jgi:hypothetical protein
MYEISDKFQVLRDSPKRIDFHIRTGDYFSFLATMLGIIEDRMTNGEDIEECVRMAHELRTDLRYVQANYAIRPRELGDIQMIRPKGNLIGTKHQLS